MGAGTGSAIFTPDERARLRGEILHRAEEDARLSAGAITGSAAADREDRWSDIDLAFAVADGAALPEVLRDWTEYMYGQHYAVHNADIQAGAWTYRVFLLPNTLQVDLAFVPATEFRALAPTFRVVFGQAEESLHLPPPSAAGIVGLGWLHALHARSCIKRGLPWQAEYMISGVRDNALALACIRHGLPAAHGRGMDLLPERVAAQFEGALVRGLEAGELSRAFRVALSALLSEIRQTDQELGARLEPTLRGLIETSAG